MKRDRSDQELFARIRKSDADALGILLDRYWARLVRYVATVLEPGDAAEDVAQEAFVRLWEHRRDLRPEESARAFLFRIARNAALDEHRRRQARERAASRAARPMAIPTPEDNLANSELREAITLAINALPEKRREVFTLVRHHGLSHREVAEVMNLAPQTVANHLSMALADLRSALAPYLGRSGGRAARRTVHPA
jgi:RNA polymerase sigma-70 factor (ECF subfamily)